CSIASLINFFFSRRRRHTRSKRDWSSDVCSSDLSILASVLPRTKSERQLRRRRTDRTRRLHGDDQAKGQRSNAGGTHERGKVSSRIYGTTCLAWRSEEHTSELQSRFDLVCRLLLE